MGYAGGASTRNGIISSTAASIAGRTVGYAESATVFSNFLANSVGRNVESTAVLARYTIAGDAKLNSTTDLADLVSLAQHYEAIGTEFSGGDFNYDGTAGFAELVILAQQYGKSSVEALAFLSLASTTKSRATRRIADLLQGKPHAGFAVTAAAGLGRAPVGLRVGCLR